MATAATRETFLTVPEVARLLRVSEPTIYRRVSDKTLPAVRVGPWGPIRIRASELERVLEISRTSYETPAKAPRTSSEAVDVRQLAGEGKR